MLKSFYKKSQKSFLLFLFFALDQAKKKFFFFLLFLLFFYFFYFFFYLFFLFFIPQGTICGDVGDFGACNEKDSVNLFLQSILTLGVAPIIPQRKLIMIPVDFVAKFVHSLCTEKIKQSLELKYFNIFGDPENCLYLEDVTRNFSYFFYSIQLMDLNKWRIHCKKFPTSPIFPILHFFDHSFPFNENTEQFSKKNFDLINHLDLPTIEPRNLLSWINYFILNGLVQISTL